MESKSGEYQGPGENLRQYWEWQAEKERTRASPPMQRLRMGKVQPAGTQGPPSSEGVLVTETLTMPGMIPCL